MPPKKKSNPVSLYLSKIGQKGGKAGKGPVKARSSEQARAAVNQRWAKHRKQKGQDMEKDPTFKLHSIPVWFSKSCRDALKRAGQNSVGDQSTIIQQLLEHEGVRLLWDHFGTVKRGDKRHLVAMPYVHLERAKVLEFAKLIGAALVSENAQRGFWSPNSYYYEFAPIDPT